MFEITNYLPFIFAGGGMSTVLASPTLVINTDKHTVLHEKRVDFEYFGISSHNFFYRKELSVQIQ